MDNLQKPGAYAALFQALAYITGFAVFFILLDASAYIGPVRQVAFLIDNKPLLNAVSLLIYVLFGVALVILTLALHRRLESGAQSLSQIGAAFGLIWAGMVIASGMIFIVGMDSAIKLYSTDQQQAASVWQTVGVIHEGIGGGIELVGGLWVLLVSWAALKSGVLPKLLNYVGMVVGVAGILTMIPGLGDLAEIFGLGQIIWFFWLGITMLRTQSAVQ